MNSHVVACFFIKSTQVRERVNKADGSKNELPSASSFILFAFHALTVC